MALRAACRVINKRIQTNKKPGRMYLFPFISLFSLFGGFAERRLREPHYDGTVPVDDKIWVYLERPTANAMALRADMQRDNKYKMTHGSNSVHMVIRCGDLEESKPPHRNEVLDQLRLGVRYM